MPYPNLSDVTQKWVELLQPFLRDYNVKYTSSNLQSLTNIPQQTISRILIQLVDIGLINYKIEGRNKKYYLDLSKGTTELLIKILEDFKALNFSLGTRSRFLIINEILNSCDCVVLFGSYANNSFNEKSDLDVILINCKNKDSVEKIKNREVIEINEHYVTLAEFQKSLKEKNALSIEILQNHILFGDSSKIIKYYIENAKR